MKAVFVNRFFHPDAAPTAVLAADVAFDWAAAGVEVHAIAGRSGYAGDGTVFMREETVRGVRIHRVATARSRRGSLAARALDYAGFHLLAGWRLWRLVRRGDVVVAKTDPPLLSVTAAIVTMMRRATLMNWFQDVFPEVAQRAQLRAMPGAGLALAARLRDWSMRRAAVNVVVGEGMRQLLAQRAAGARIEVIPNWADGSRIHPSLADAALRREWGLGDRFVVGYSGNLGRAHDVGTLVGAARLLEAREDVVFSFVGGGHGMARLKEAGLRNVRIRGYVPDSSLGATLCLADVHVVTLAPRFEGLIVPSKLYGIAAAGRPVIFVGDVDGEVARAIGANDCGIAVRSGDAASLADAIVQLAESPARRREMGERARCAFEAEWDRPVALARWRGMLEAALGRYSRNRRGAVSP